MGEAKRRKANDPNFGRPDSVDDRRGIVLSSPVVVEGGDLMFKTTGLDSSELRFALLYWDDLVWPASNDLHSWDAEADFLQSQGVLTRPLYRYSRDLADSFVSAHLDAKERQKLLEGGRSRREIVRYF